MCSATLTVRSRRAASLLLSLALRVDMPLTRNTGGDYAWYKIARLDLIGFYARLGLLR